MQGEAGFVGELLFKGTLGTAQRWQNKISGRKKAGTWVSSLPGQSSSTTCGLIRLQPGTWPHLGSHCQSLGKGWDPADFSFAFHLSVFSKFSLRIRKENEHFNEHPYKVGQMRKCRRREARGDLEAKLSAS